MQEAFVLVQQILNQSKDGAKIETSRAKILPKCFDFIRLYPSFTINQKEKYTVLSMARIGTSILNLIDFSGFNNYKLLFSANQIKIPSNYVVRHSLTWTKRKIVFNKPANKN